MDKLTNKNFWQKYWSNYQVEKQETFFLEELIDKIPNNSNIIEIGGFPGNMLVHFYKKKNCKITLFDFYIDKNIIQKVEEINELPSNTINYIEGDFFAIKPIDSYDIVCSFGFIEHFLDTKNVIKRHLDILKPGGQLIITLPNFSGINGWIQKKIDLENYQKHNINCMNKDYLEDIMKSFGLNNFEVQYIGKPAVWVEKSIKLNWRWSLLIKNLNRFLKRQPFTKNQITSPHFLITATK